MSEPTTPTHVDRRVFLRGMLATAGGAALGACASSGSGDSESAAASTDEVGPAPLEAVTELGTVSAAAVGRTLVVIELDGGMDGLDLVVPYADPAYPRLRPTIGLDLDAVLPIDDEMALHPNLVNLHALGVGIVEGVGMASPDLSHFESMRRWWQGDMTGTGTTSTGFLGRCCDVLAADEPVTGVSIGRTSSPALRSDEAVTLSVPDPYSGGWLLSDDPWIEAARAGNAAAARSDGDDLPLAITARANMTKALDFLDVLRDLPETDQDLYPGSDLAHRLATTARLLQADTGLRIVHIPWGSFDTHDDHRGSFDYQMMELDEALAAFVRDLEGSGLRDSTLIATTSEFGRRPEENAGGTDHGTASSMLLVGPVTAGRHGEKPSLDDLDDDGNLVATVPLVDYYATLAESWLGVPNAMVLATPGTPIPGTIA